MRHVDFGATQVCGDCFPSARLGLGRPDTCDDGNAQACLRLYVAVIGFRVYGLGFMVDGLGVRV